MVRTEGGECGRFRQVWWGTIVGEYAPQKAAYGLAGVSMDDDDHNEDAKEIDKEYVGSILSQANTFSDNPNIDEYIRLRLKYTWS
jgi:hypothetical protein